MSFLAPLFLLGALAVAGPVLFHLIRRSARERIPFSSLMFVPPTPPRVVRRKKLEHVGLLILRCLCLVLLGTAFARPLFARKNPAPPPAAGGCHRVVLVDTSASMRRENLWNQARRIAEGYLEKSSPEDQIALLTFDRQPRTLVRFDEWNGWAQNERAALAGERLAAESPRWMGTHLGMALTSAAEQFVSDSDNAPAPARREVIVITDLQEGSRLDGLQGFDWLSGIHVILEPVRPQKTANAGLQIPDHAPRAAIGQQDNIHVRVTNARDSDQEKFQLSWSVENPAPAGGQSTDIYLSPGQTRTFPAPQLPAGINAGSLHLTGDDADFDNVTYFAAAEREQVRVACFGADSADDPMKLRYYLERVFNPTSRRQVQLIGSTTLPSPPNTRGGIQGEGNILNQAAFAIIPASLDPQEIKQVRAWLAQGKAALLVLTGPEMGPTLSGLLQAPEIQVTEVEGPYVLLGEIDFQHPLFSPFAEPRFSDFTSIHFWKHRRWEAPPGMAVRVLAKFDDGSPALAQVPVEKGHLLVLASGWHPADSQLALSSKFAPLMETLLDWSGAGAPRRWQFLTGEIIPSPVSSGEAVQWQKPDGKRIALSAGMPFTETETPGIYLAAAGAAETQRFAVNLPLDESRTASLSPDELARLGVPLQTSPEISPAQARERQGHLRLEELENRQKLWRWLIAGALALIFGEILLSGWLARRSYEPQT